MIHSLGVKRHFLVMIWILIYKDTLAAPNRPKYQTCPFNKTEWEDRAATMFCQGNDVYHCLLTQDKATVSEHCVEKSLVLKGHCPIFTNEGYLHWATCNDTDCPNSSFVSNEVYQYRVCFEKTDDLVIYDDANIHGDNKQSNGALIAVLVAVSVLLMLVVAAVVFAVIYFRSRLCQKGQDEAVADGVHELQSKNFVYVVGKLGNSVSTAGKNIASQFARKKQMSTKFLNYLSLSDDFKFSENTVYFIDGWFGLWNINPCEESGVRKTLNLLSEEIKSIRKTKFVIGVRTEVKRDYESVFESSGVSFENRTIYLDSSSEQRGKSIGNHFRKIKRKCNKADCPCKKIGVQEIMEVKDIGTHLTLNLLELDHDLGNVMIDKDGGPIVAMKGHFKALKLDENLFAAILYIVLNGFYDENNFRDDIAKKFGIKKLCLEHENLGKYTRKIESPDSDDEQQHALAPMWSSKISGDRALTTSAVVFWHNILYISAFHACYEESDYKKEILLHCNMDAILQLVRPVGQRQADVFTVEADLDSISSFYEKRIKGKEIEDHVKDHPLMEYLKQQ